MNILTLQYGNMRNLNARGGLPLAVHETLRRIALRHKVDCRTGHCPERKGSQSIDGIKYIHRGIGGSKFADRIIFSLKHSFAGIHVPYDLVLIPWDRYAPVFFPSKTTRPVVMELHLQYFSTPGKSRIIDPVAHLLLKRQLGKCRYVIAVSEEVMLSATPYMRNIKLKTVIYNGVSDELLSYPLDSGKDDYLLFLGRLDIGHKGIDVLVSAYESASIDVPLLIVGDGPDRAKVLKMIERQNLGRMIRLTGWLEGQEKLQILNDAMAVCLPSRGEGFSLVATEAAAMGKPVIGTKVPGLNEAVLHGKTGILVQRDDIHGYASALKQIVSDEKMRKRLGTEARKRARRLTWERAAEKKEQFFFQVMEDFRASRQ